MLKASQVRTKRAAFAEASMSSTPASCAGWLPTIPTDEAVEAREAADDVLRVVLVDLEELVVVDDQLDDVAHVIRLVRVVRHDRVELRVHPLRVVASAPRAARVCRLFCGRKPIR